MMINIIYRYINYCYRGEWIALPTGDWGHKQSSIYSVKQNHTPRDPSMSNLHPRRTLRPVDGSFAMQKPSIKNKLADEIYICLLVSHSLLVKNPFKSCQMWRVSPGFGIPDFPG
jgi:hypothetical protein